jgi:hypothetical protein
MFPTRMCLARLRDGGLWVHSPIALSDPLRDKLASLGPVRHLVAPNDLHHTYLPAWSIAFPNARVQATAGVQEKCPFVSVDDPLLDRPPADWLDTFDLVVFNNNRITTEAVFYHRPSGTVIFTDILQQMPVDWFTGWRALVARLDRMTGPAPAVPRKYRLGFRDRAALRDALTRIRSWQPRQLVMAHGPVVTQNTGAVLARAFAWAT